MKDRNFLAELLLKKPQQAAPISAPVMPAGGVATSPQAQLSTPQALTPVSVLDRREDLANMLLKQAADRSVHPIARGLAAYLGTKQSKEIDAERTKTEAALTAKAEAEKAREIEMENKLFELKERETAATERGADLQARTLEQAAKQFEQTLSFNREKFNKEMQRDLNNNAVIKIRDPKGEVDLLFKGNAPVTDGLEKGLQWGVDDKGNRIAVPIATQPNDKAAQQKEIMKETVNRLLANEKGLRENFGAFDQYTPALQENTRQALTDLNQLRALLTVDNLSLMTGVLSETDIKILQNVSGGQIADTASEDGVVEAVKKMQKALNGEPKKVANQTPIPNSGFKILGAE